MDKVLKNKILKKVKSRLENKNTSRKEELNESLKELQSFLDNISVMNLLKESLVFNEDDNEEFIEQDFEPENDEMRDIPEENNTPDNISSKIDAIRKSALEIVAELSNRTDDPNYELAKKIWMMCDKKNTDAKKPTENN
jgi:hypothetical protein